MSRLKNSMIVEGCEYLERLDNKEKLLKGEGKWRVNKINSVLRAA